MNKNYRLRFPPSPTGHLHIGNVRTALYNWLLARKTGGIFLLRIEDTDAQRSTRESEDKLLEDLQWLGLDWDEGPGMDGLHAPYRQSERLEIYEEHTKQLMADGMAYYCFCTPELLKAEREKALAESRPPRYSGTCRSLNPSDAGKRVKAGEPAAVRFRIEEGPAVAWTDLVHGELNFDREIIGDFVIVRSEGTPAYNYAVVVDDALMEITHVIRGDDHISNTPRQILLYQALGFTTPQFGHLPMILGPDGSRLSKRHGATSVAEFRQQGYLPEALINYLALLGWNPGDEREFFTLEELTDVFSIERINKSAAKFDTDKLTWLNGQHLRSLPAEKIAADIKPLLQARGFLPTQTDDTLTRWTVELADAFSSGASTLRELVEDTKLVFDYSPAGALNDPEAAEIVSTDQAKSILTCFLDDAERSEAIDVERYKDLAKAVSKRTGARGRELFHPLRVAITGKSSGPELQLLIPLLEKGKSLELPNPILGVRARVEAMVKMLGES